MEMYRRLRELSGDIRMLLDCHAAGKILGIAPSTLAIWRSTKRYALPFVKIGRLVRYREQDIEKFVESRLRNSEDQS
jgi:predicted DNA-binding transcriptional regulator AlpA